MLWNGVGERSLFGPDLIKDAEEKVKLVKDGLKIAQSRQKSYRILSVEKSPTKLEIELILEYHHFVE